MTEAHGDEHAADLVDEFAAAAGELLPRFGAEQIKAIGDALMIRVPEAAGAVLLGCELTGELLAEHGYPEIRVGMHHGPAIERGGDWFGASVNLAARISGLAAGGEVLLSGATREAAGEVNGVRFIKRGAQRLRNVSALVHLYAAVPRGATARGTVTDPVCRMALDPERTAGSLRYEGRDYQFCSLECAARFAAAPEAYAPR